ncbi:MAG: hypothetical protein LBR97_04675 [Dysgonamonadaceae bacterium]|jgi:hypothetical protein|nr:hypothetical protein [Dysgonamonadaceae bacterium]
MKTDTWAEVFKIHAKFENIKNTLDFYRKIKGMGDCQIIDLHVTDGSGNIVKFGLPRQFFNMNEFKAYIFALELHATELKQKLNNL